MPKHNQKLGKYGETLARNWLETNNYQILFQNWRFKHLEIDIVCQKSNQLVFVEVKTTFAKTGFFPEMNISHQKQERLRRAAAAFYHKNPSYTELPARFDVLAITVFSDQQPEIYPIEDAFR